MDKLFRKFKGGDVRALADLLEAERSRFFDYVLRMTGQVSRSVDSIDDAYQALTDDVLSDTPSYADLRVTLYQMARRFNADIWHADTSKLANAALESSPQAQSRQVPVKGDKRSARAVKGLHAFRALDRSLRALPGHEREAVLLKTRSHFDFYHIAMITGLSGDEVETHFLTGMTKIDAQCSGLVDGPEETLACMPDHPAPLRSSQATINLSLVMQGIKTRPVGLSSPLRFLFLVVLGVVVGAAFFYPESLRNVARMLEAFVSRRGF